MTLVFTTLTLICFAANSLLCRLALGGRAIDAASFTSVRIVSGALMLLAISAIASRSRPAALPAASCPSRPSCPALEWRLPFALFFYAITFSYAYVSLTASTGALILFGAVQTTMLTAALVAGERPRPLEWSGLALAFLGLVVLTAPGLAGPPLRGSLSMAASGICWGFYSLWGRDVGNPLQSTTRNFVRVTPLSLMVSLATLGRAHVTTSGAVLAATSGALASGVGYVLWYSALAGLSATRAATVQFAAPVFAAAGGVLLLSEPVSLRLIVATVLILGGIGLAHLRHLAPGAPEHVENLSTSRTSVTLSPDALAGKEPRVRISLTALASIVLATTLLTAQKNANRTLDIYVIDVEGGNATLFVSRPANRC